MRPSLSKLLPTLRYVQVVVLAACTLAANASHLVGGGITYTYLGETSPGSGQFRYRISVRFYLNCGDDSSYPNILQFIGGENGTIPVGVYKENPDLPNAPKQLQTTAQLQLVEYAVITPDLPSGCVLGTGACAEQSFLEGEVVVPANVGGYHLFFDAYARNGEIDNLSNPDSQGIGYYAYIPPATIANSSPTWLGISVPYVCIGDTTTFSNSAEDVDGDSLVFAFVEPLASQVDFGGVSPPPNPLAWPLNGVGYLGGFSATAPFGPDGYAFINSTTGATAFSATTLGNWSVCVEIREYRNGVLIGRILNDMQLLSSACPDNNAPIPDLPPGDTALVTSYTVDAGGTLCIPLFFVDPDGDTIKVKATGTIFDEGETNPPAQMVGPLVGDSLVNAQFCWPTGCDQFRDEPYLFNVVVSDQECPPGTVTYVFEVTVTPTPEPQLEGPAVVCEDQTTATYCVEPLPGASYDWTVNGGSIVDGDGTNCVSVFWSEEGQRSLELERTALCVTSSTRLVDVFPPPQAAFEMDPDTLCEGLRLRAIDLSQGASSYQWVSSRGDSLTTAEPEFRVSFSDSVVFTLVVTSPEGCSDTTYNTFAPGSYKELVQYYVPNVFSPNGDNKNDRFGLVSNSLLEDCTTLEVWDRWGKEMFTSTDNRKTWSGLAPNGERAPEGVYFYELDVFGDVFRGNVHLLR
jgi:gliding motility-associated-like protein